MEKTEKMKIKTLIVFSSFAFILFSQEKNCYSINGGNYSFQLEIWKEKPDTVFSFIQSDSKVLKENIENGDFKFDLSINKTWKVYLVDKTTLIEQFTIRDSLLVGFYSRYFTNGNTKIKAFYINGKLNGEYTSFYSNGKIENHIDYKDGEVSGSYIKYYENGFIKSTSNYCDGHFVKVEYRYWDNDKLASVNFYSENLSYFVENPINMYFDTDGSSISEFEFKEIWYCK